MSTSGAGLPAPLCQLDLPECVELSGKKLTSLYSLSRNDFLQEPWERVLKTLPARIPFTLTALPAEGETIGVNFVTYYGKRVDGEGTDEPRELSRFLRRRLEVELAPGAEGRRGDDTNSRWGIDEAALQIGDEAQRVSLPRADGTLLDLGEVIGEGNVIVTTYRAEW